MVIYRNNYKVVTGDMNFRSTKKMNISLNLAKLRLKDINYKIPQFPKPYLVSLLCFFRTLSAMSNAFPNNVVYISPKFI